ncbi:hypothetical protein OTB20_11950 [Streptomyces sp. H27-H1]|uniref:hypothetical protein n=1 Tax=Streptomyces sp. H27-H1 TaxID=2996461 RepID=UPI00227187EB|nr:hypothetical protein [Streptomyces sp. H27-H1]MCY0926903.1 hypothetical protein [Streptomyces sp. H27-H1]
MTNELGTDEDPPEKVRLEELKDEYRRANKAHDALRETLEEEVATGQYTDEEADDMSVRLEDSGRERLDEIHARIEAHCRAYGLPL